MASTVHPKRSDHERPGELDATSASEPPAPVVAKQPRGALSIAYTGGPVRVDLRKVRKSMYVPDLGEDEQLGDDEPGEVAAQLCLAAIDAGALIIPQGLTVECSGCDDSMGGLFQLRVCPADDLARGVASPWIDVLWIAADGKDANDPAAVKSAVSYIHGRLNALLGLPATQSARARCQS